MAAKDRSTLKEYFQDGARPSGADFADLIDSFLLINELSGALLAGLTAQNAEINETDNILSALGKAQGQLNNRVKKDGDALSGPLALHADPASAMHAATKQYVDAVAGSGGGGSTGAVKRVYHFCHTGSINNATLGLYKVSSEAITNNKPTTAEGHGIKDGSIDPYVIMNNCTIKKIRVTFAGAGVDGGSVGANPVMRLRVFKSGYDARTQVGTDVDIPVSNSGLGTWGNASGNGFQTAVSGELNFALNAGDVLGVEFRHQTGSGNSIISVQRLFAVLETEE
ncbi:hypothetical protein RCC89_19565 [Cytophagaceae bacterium ABcell3]|nr:hypothetical protein RCC89_19565 [Cytophagaceae bacterium ABcell3]